MSMRKVLAGAALLCFAIGGFTIRAAGAADTPGLGKPITEADIKAWNITILPDGTNLPPGSGTAAQGAKLFVDKGCVACHGEGAKGANAAALVGRPSLVDGGIEANKTIANFWAYSTTLYDYIRRAMPWPQPRSLSNEEVYSLVAYILSINKIIGENDTMNAETLPKVLMPNRENFIVRFPDKI
jgi:mono/diheme cytochrome c family protein